MRCPQMYGVHLNLGTVSKKCVTYNSYKCIMQMSQRTQQAYKEGRNHASKQVSRIHTASLDTRKQRNKQVSQYTANKSRKAIQLIVNNRVCNQGSKRINKYMNM